MGFDMELAINASGYKDTTAYQALQAVRETEKKDGQVWAVIMGNKRVTQDVLILREFKEFCVGFLIVNREQPDDEYVGIVINGENKYIDRYRTTYIYKDKLRYFVCDTTQEEFEGVRKAFADAYGFPVEDDTETPEMVTEEPVAAPVERCNDSGEDINEQLKTALMIAQAERNAYKDMCEKMIKQFAKGGVA